MKHKMVAPVMILLLVVLAGCTTSRYNTAEGYEGFSAAGARSVQQMKKSSYRSDMLYSTYDDEFVYNEEGEVIRHIQISYYDKGEKSDRYEVVYQKLGGVILPQSVSINGVLYMEVEYDLLPVEHQGDIASCMTIPSFYQLIKTPFSSEEIQWSIDIDNFEVPFRYDGKFVTSDRDFSFYDGFSSEKSLSPGFDNIVLTRFFYSGSEFLKGYKRSEKLAKDGAKPFDIEKSSYSSFIFSWEAIDRKICQTSALLDESNGEDTIHFRLNREFDPQGRPTSEKWTIQDSISNELPVVVYNQQINY